MRGMSAAVPLDGVLTSAVQVTRAPLNSRWSSFSTAVLRSLPVSNSTNLVSNVNSLWPSLDSDGKDLPFALFTAGFRIDNVQSRQTGEVFQVLNRLGESGFQVIENDVSGMSK